MTNSKESAKAKVERMMLLEISKMVGEVGSKKLLDAISWICREYPGDSFETEFGDISIFADAAEALGWPEETTICYGCGQEQTRQYKIGCAALFNGHVGDGWVVTDYSPIADEILCYDCGGRYQDDTECECE